MDASQESMLDDSNKDMPSHANNITQTTFTPAFNPSSTITHLAAENLPVGKVQRAWDRKPQSPFSRRKVKFGKVWKRAPGHSAAAFAGNYKVHIRDSFTFGNRSPMKAVKKLRTVSGDAHVADWEARGSPRARRIVTRSGAAATGEALEELEEEGGDEFENRRQTARTEVIHEGESLAENCDDEDGEEWEEFEELQDESEFQPTLMHLGEIIGHASNFDNTEESTVVSEEPNTAITQDVASRSSIVDDVRGYEGIAEEQEVDEPKEVEAQTEDVLAPDEMFSRVPELAPPSAHLALPDGFVSPAKGRRQRPISYVRQAQAKRRQTLPVSFTSAEIQAPHRAILAATYPSEDDSANIMDGTTGCDQDPLNPIPALNPVDAGPHFGDVGPDDDDWEDEDEDEESANTTVDDDNSLTETELTTIQPISDQSLPETFQKATENSSPETLLQMEAISSPELAGQLRSNVVAPDRNISSPIPSITGHHPRFPLRRSRRRQSTSPLRRSTILPLSDRSHLVAFTPVRLRPTTDCINKPDTVREVENDQTSWSGNQNAGHATLVANEDFSNASPVRGQACPSPLPQLERSSSAPPEERQLSPQKPRQPRISDDTALLQAFLKRANENKSSTGISVAKRESLENRRDSDSVRLALAHAGQISPEENQTNSIAGISKTTPLENVLADLDPNSPSPRKQLTTAGVTSTSKSEENQPFAPDEGPSKPLDGRGNRRSGRAKKKDQNIAENNFLAPNRISIKGSTDSVILKKSEVQEMAALTKTNTRKNKAGAVLPPMRLHKLAAEKLLAEGQSADAIDQVRELKQKIRWAETLASFHGGGSEAEVSLTNDEPDTQPDTLAGAVVDSDMTEMPSAVPASETPSKPRLRRMKPPRPTASTPAKATVTSADATHQVSNESTPRPTRRGTKARLATPGKPRASSKVGSNGDANESIHVPATQEAAPTSSNTKVITKRKPAASKLPAPVSSVYLSTGYAPAGKAGSHSAETTFTISSPPKKRGRQSFVAPAIGGRNAPVPKFTPAKPGQEAEDNGMAVPILVPSLSSPAKQDRRIAATMLVPGPREARERTANEDSILPPSLGSPAKKRTRRLGG